jgi:hypothetical protein
VLVRVGPEQLCAPVHHLVRDSERPDAPGEDQQQRSGAEREGIACQRAADQVAEAAGFIKGAVCSNFRSKTDLFMGVVERRLEEQISVMTRAAANATIGEATRRLLAPSAEAGAGAGGGSGTGGGACPG